MLADIDQPPQLFFLYMASMRWVTRKPPKMLTLARTRRDEAEDARPPGALTRREVDADRQQRADDDDTRNRVGDRHQRRVQRRGHRPDHVVADEDRQHEDRQPEDERIDRPAVTACAAAPPASPSLIGNSLGICRRSLASRPPVWRFPQPSGLLKRFRRGQISHSRSPLDRRKPDGRWRRRGSARSP